jgi:uncharacterized protein YegP (UPF0339 family)
VLTREHERQVSHDLLASSGRVIATSEPYNTKSRGDERRRSIRKNAAGAALDNQTK